MHELNLTFKKIIEKFEFVKNLEKKKLTTSIHSIDIVIKKDVAYLRLKTNGYITDCTKNYTTKYLTKKLTEYLKKEEFPY